MEKQNGGSIINISSVGGGKNLSDEFRNQFLRHIPLGRMGQPAEIAEAVCCFASDTSAYTTGQILTVSGGFGLATPIYADLSSKNATR